MTRVREGAIVVREIGPCGECRRMILSSDQAWASLSRGTPVYGRIGAPSSEISGIARGPTVHRCHACLESVGPLR